MNPERLTIGRVAKLAGVGVETIRFYEREGLLNQPRRNQSGYRIFDPDVVNRIRFIRCVSQLGFSLKEIREILLLQAASEGTDTQLKKRFDSKIQEIDCRITGLQHARTVLAQISRSAEKDVSTGSSLLDLFVHTS